ncbi:kelch repeat and BTB domain-containing protein 13 [Pristis pectinata]|uniref:kelch repeat and BTB domain-containing protein 13 n=1 Tax=Pristis pectinata TaxID=685728 RepID=UPI00223D42F9|nr:kelch repeat and BTB domain-containing protein 13 [Pristis pectinata]
MQLAAGYVRVKVEDEIFTVEKRMLIEGSEYFRALFESGMRECSQEEIGLQQLPASGFTVTMRVLMGERPILDSDEITDAIECAAFLQVKPLTEHLIHIISSKNCIVMFQTAAVYGLFDLLHVSALFIRDVYSNVREDLSFLPEDQLDYIESLSPSTFVAVATHSPSAQYLDDRSRTICYLDEAENSWRTLTSLPVKASTSLAGIAVVDNNIYIVGGVDGLSKQIVKLNFCYNTERNSWSEFPSLQHLRHNLTLTGQGGCLYAIGGMYKNMVLATVEKYHVASNTWSFAAHLPRPGEGIACTQAMGRIFVCLWFPMDTTDIYEYKTQRDEWLLVTTLKRQQSYGHCMVAHMDNLYVIRNGPADDFLRCFIDCFNLTRQQWMSLSGYYFNSKGALFTATIRGDKVFTVNRMLTLIYDIQKDKWKPAKEGAGFPRSGSMHTFLLRLPKHSVSLTRHVARIFYGHGSGRHWQEQSLLLIPNYH